MIDLNDRIRLNDLLDQKFILELKQNFNLNLLFLTGGSVRQILFEEKNSLILTDLDFVYLDCNILKRDKYFDQIFLTYFSTKKIFLPYICSFNLLRNDFFNKNGGIDISLGSWQDDMLRRDFVCNACYINVGTQTIQQYLFQLHEDIVLRQLTLIKPTRLIHDWSLIPRLIRFGIQNNLRVNPKDISFYRALNLSENIYSRTAMEFKKLFKLFSLSNCIEYIERENMSFYVNFLQNMHHKLFIS